MISDLDYDKVKNCSVSAANIYQFVQNCVNYYQICVNAGIIESEKQKQKAEPSQLIDKEIKVEESKGEEVKIVEFEISDPEKLKLVKEM